MYTLYTSGAKVLGGGSAEDCLAPCVAHDRHLQLLQDPLADAEILEVLHVAKERVRNLAPANNLRQTYKIMLLCSEGIIPHIFPAFVLSMSEGVIDESRQIGRITDLISVCKRNVFK